MSQPKARQVVRRELGRDLQLQEIRFLLNASVKRRYSVEPIDPLTVSSDALRGYYVEASKLLLALWGGDATLFDKSVLMDSQYAEARRTLGLHPTHSQVTAPSLVAFFPPTDPQAPSMLETSSAHDFEFQLDRPEPKRRRPMTIDDINEEVENSSQQHVVQEGSDDEEEEDSISEPCSSSEQQQGIPTPLPSAMNASSSMSLEQVVAVWAVTEGVQRKKAATLLRMLRQTKPNVDFDSLPMSWATVMRQMGAEGVGEDTLGTPIHLHLQADQSHIPPSLRTNPPITIVNAGNYYFFGVLDTLLGKSIGSLNYFENLASFRHFYIVRPDFFNNDLLQATNLRPGMEDDWDETRKKLPLFDVRHGSGRTSVLDYITLLVDMNIDGVRVASVSSRDSLLTPVLVRLAGVQTHLGTFRFRHAKYGVCAYILGHQKPPYSVLLRDVAAELTARAPSVPNLQMPMPTLRLKLWRGICDSPARADCLNCMSFSSLGGSPRCKQSGVKKRNEITDKMSGVLFVNLDCENIPRLASEWNDYRQDSTALPAHVKEQPGPFEGVPDFDPVYDFILDVMHILDGGVLQALALNLGTAGNKSIWMHGNDLNAINGVISWYNDYMLVEFQRKFSTLDEVNTWKMRVTRNFFMYPALVIIMEFKNRLRPQTAEFWTNQVHTIVGAVRRCAGYSVKPVPEENLDEATCLFKKYLVDRKDELGDSFLWYKHHQLKHLTEDMRNKPGHADDNSAYEGEAVHPKWDQLIHKGPVPDLQMRNRMAEMYSFKLPVDSQGNLHKTSVTDDKIAYLLKHHPSDDLFDELPANTPVRVMTGVESNRQGKALVFEGFQLRHTFPNNVCKRKDGRFFFITKLEESSPGVFTLAGHEFQDVQGAFQGRPTENFGYAMASNGLRMAEESFSADCVRTKCFPLPIDALRKVGKWLEPFIPQESGVVPDLGWKKWMLIDLID